MILRAREITAQPLVQSGTSVLLLWILRFFRFFKSKIGRAKFVIASSLLNREKGNYEEEEDDDNTKEDDKKGSWTNITTENEITAPSWQEDPMKQNTQHENLDPKEEKTTIKEATKKKKGHNQEKRKKQQEGSEWRIGSTQ